MESNWRYNAWLYGMTTFWDQFSLGGWTGDRLCTPLLDFPGVMLTNFVHTTGGNLLCPLIVAGTQFATWPPNLSAPNISGGRFPYGYRVDPDHP